MPKAIPALVVSASLAIGLCCPALAQDARDSVSVGRPTHRIPRVNSEINVDAVLDEPFWEHALVLTMDYEVRPGENIPPPVRTRVLLAYDDTRLFAAFRADDPDPSLIRARLTDRDEMWDDDWVVLNLDTFNDARKSYLFVCNPLGVQADIIETTGGPSCPFDAIWDSAGRITSEGYIVEMAIPFRALRFQRSSEDQIWGIDAIRSYPREVRHHIGLFPRDRSNNCYLCQADKIIGFAGVSPGRNIEIDPTLSAINSQARQGDEDIPQGEFQNQRSDVEAGITGTWGFTPNLTLCGTLNPDFSQIEADVLQLDVNTQYALYYEERRPFFLEGMHIFESRLGVVYTRTLADPVWGAKITGKEGSNVIGFYMVEDDVTNFLFPSAYTTSGNSMDSTSLGTVLRYRRDINDAATLGIMLTDREGTAYFNRVASIDGDFRVTDKDRIQVQGLYTGTRYPDEIVAAEDQPEGTFTGSGLDVHYFHNTGTLDWYGMVRRLERGIRADLGYRPQVDYNYGTAGVGYTFNRESGGWYTMLNFGGSYQYEETTAHELIQKGTSGWFNYTGPKESFFDTEVYFGDNRYEGANYGIRRVYLDGGFWPSGSVFMMAWCLVGDGIDYENSQAGKVLTLAPETEVKLGLRLELSYRHTYEHLNVEGGRLYTANIDYLKAIYQLSKRAFVRAILQYVDYDFDPDLYIEETDPEYQNLFSQFLFSYKINPQTVLYLGYSDNYYGNQDYTLTQSDHTFFAKMGYAITL
jgi:hypothetical protein